MSTEASLTTLEPLPEPEPQPKVPRRPRSKIGRMPKSLRDQLNQMLQDGVPYEDIRQKLGEPGQSLTIDNISEWRTKGGYEDWVREQFWREEMLARTEAFSPIIEDDPSQLPLAGLQMSLVQICEQLRDLGPGARSGQFENHADKYLRMLNSLARISKTLLAVQEFRNAAAKAAARELKKRDPKREFNEPERQALLDRADDFFNIKSAARLRQELQAPPAPNGTT